MTGRALIIGLGSSPEPVACSIQGHQPEFVCFFTSHESVDKVPTVRERSGRNYTDHKVLVRDIEDLQHCYERALHCCRVVEERGFTPEDVVVDYTGGTKVMSAALVLATVTRGYRFSYVGGRERDPNQRGVVVDGESELRRAENPWDVMAVNGLQHISWAFNRHAYSLALAEAQRLIGHEGLSRRIRHLLQALAPIANAYLHWDRFDHRAIGDSLKTGYSELAKVVELTQLEALEPLVSEVRETLEFYNAFRQETRNFSPDKLSRYHVSDLVANARRRASEEKFDDAVARLYRALEMRAQVALAARGIRTDAITAEQVPNPLREDFVTRFADAGGRLRVPLLGAYQLLSAFKDPVAAAFFAQESEFTKILSSRNSSILAHGNIVQSQQGFNTFLSLVEPLLEHPVPKFPRLSLESLF